MYNLQREMEELREKCLEAVDYVGAANYGERIALALARVDEAVDHVLSLILDLPEDDTEGKFEGEPREVAM